jgi:hypothetical protein
LGENLAQEVRAICGNQSGTPQNAAHVILRDDVYRIGTIELIQLGAVSRLKLPAKPFDEHLVAIAGDLRIQAQRKPLLGT